MQGKILVIGAVEVIDRDINLSKSRARHAKYIDTRSGRIRLAVIADNSAASIKAFIIANVRPGTTLITDGHASYPGLEGYRHDPRVVAKWLPTSSCHGFTGRLHFSSAGALAHITACAANMPTLISTSSCSDTTAAFTGMFHSKPCSASPPTTSQPATGRSSNAKTHERARGQRPYYI